MASEDVLEMAEMLLRTRNTDALALVQTVEALAAEVRELRRDKARLDWMINKWPWYDQDGPPRDREEIDAAMGEPQND